METETHMQLTGNISGDVKMSDLWLREGDALGAESGPYVAPIFSASPLFFQTFFFLPSPPPRHFPL